MTIYWLGQPEEDAHELKEQAIDAAGVACAAVQDILTTPPDRVQQMVEAAALDAESQVSVARAAHQQVIAISTANPTNAEIAGFVTEAQAAVANAESCATEARNLASGMRPTAAKKKGEGWVWAMVAAMALAVGVVATT